MILSNAVRAGLLGAVALTIVATALHASAQSGPSSSRGTRPQLDVPPAPAAAGVAAEAKRAPSAPAPIPEQAALLISVKSDKSIYRNGERVRISGRVVNVAREARPSAVFIMIAKSNNGQVAWDNAVFTNVLEVTGAEFVDESYTIQLPESGNPFWGRSVDFAISAQGIPRGSDKPEATTWAISSYTVQDIGYGWLAVIVLLPGSFVIASVTGSIVGCMRVPTKVAARGVLWVIYCSALLYLAVALIGPLLISFSPGTEAFVRTTPVGVAKVVTAKIKEQQWVLNVGGVITGDTVSGGYVVPLFVLVLGMVGGVINMFLKLPEFLYAYHGIPAGVPEEAIGVSGLRSDVFRYFVFILTGPFLAMVMYSVMALADFTSPLVLGVVAFSVGFRSDRIVQWMLIFTQSYLDRAQGQESGPTAGAPAAARPDPAASVAAQPNGNQPLAAQPEAAARTDGTPKDTAPQPDSKPPIL